MKPRRKSALILLSTFLPFTLGAAEQGKTIEVQVGMGESLEMAVPSDLQGLTWEGVKDYLPAVFLTSTKNGVEGVNQLLTTARVLGNLYTAEYEKVAGLVEDGADLGQAEAAISRIKSGEAGKEARQKFLEAEAVIFWRFMLEDYASANKLKSGSNDVPNSEPIFLDQYADMLGQGNGGIYASVLQQIAVKNPSSISSYLITADARRASAVASAVQGFLALPPN